MMRGVARAKKRSGNCRDYAWARGGASRRARATATRARSVYMYMYMCVEFYYLVRSFARTDALAHRRTFFIRAQVVVGGNGSVNEDKFSLSVSAPFAGDGSVTLNAKPNYRPCTYLLRVIVVACSSSSSFVVR